MVKTPPLEPPSASTSFTSMTINHHRRLWWFSGRLNTAAGSSGMADVPLSFLSRFLFCCGVTDSHLPPQRWWFFFARQQQQRSCCPISAALRLSTSQGLSISLGSRSLCLSISLWFWVSLSLSFSLSIARSLFPILLFWFGGILTQKETTEFLVFNFD